MPPPSTGRNDIAQGSTMFNVRGAVDFNELLGQINWSESVVGLPHQNSDAYLAAQRLVSEARNWWASREEYRKMRREGRNYYKGGKLQWNENVVGDHGEVMKEHQLIEARGQVPITMNIAGSAISNVVGQFRQNKSERLAFAVSGNDTEAVEMLNLALKASRRFNESYTLEADQFLEHCLGGHSAYRTSYKWDPRLQRYEVTESAVDETKLFYNLDVKDRRYQGLRMLGVLHDVTVSQVIEKLGKNKRDAERIRALYASSASQPTWGESSETGGFYGFQGRDHDDFYRPVDPRLVRVIEVWRPIYKWVRMGIDPLFQAIPDGYGQLTLPDNEIAKIQNERRDQGQPLLELDEARYQPIWHYWYLTPEGVVLDQGPTPYYHGSHPFTLGQAFYLDGETWGMVQNIKDPQRWLNRVLGQIDYQMSTSSKGTPHVDQDVLDDSNLSFEEYMEAYSKPGGGVALRKGIKSWQDVVHYHMPNSVQPGTFELIPMLVSFVERVSGVSEAAQGITPKSGTPAQLYEQQIVQASVNVLIYLQSYFETLHNKDRKVLQTLMQSTNEPRSFARGDIENPMVYDPDRVRDIDADIALADVGDTATLRQQNEFWLIQLLQGGQIPIDVYLSESSHPRAQSVLMKLQTLQQQMMGGVPGEGGSPDEQALMQAAMIQQEQITPVQN